MVIPPINHILLYLSLLLINLGISSAKAQESTEKNPLGIKSGVSLNFPVEQFFENVQIHSISLDRRGLVYFAHSKGISEFDGVEWRDITVPGNAGIFSIQSNNEGRIYGAGERELGYLQVDRFGNTNFHSLKDSLNPILNDTFFDIEVIGDAIYFVGLNSILQLRNNHLKKIADGSFITSANLQDVLIVNDQVLGLQYFDGSELQPVKSGELIRTSSMKRINDQTLLVATRSAGFLSITSENGTVSINPWKTEVTEYINVSSVSSIDVFEEKLIAIGSYNDGVAILNFDGTVRSVLNRKEGLLNNNVYDVHFTPKATLWVGLNEGVSFLNLPDLYNDIDTPASSTNAITLEELTASKDTTSQKSREVSWFRKKVSTIKNWFSSDPLPNSVTANPEGVTPSFASIVRKVEYIPNDSLIFGGAFSQTELGVQALQQSDTLRYEFDYDFNAFRFSYATNKYEDLGNIEYQVKLEGLDRGWSTWSENTYREYTNLDWGDYTFKVRAKNDQNEASHEAEFSFSITPPWYESTWFYLIQFGSLFLALVVSGILNKTGRAISLSEALIAVVVIVIFQYVDFYIDPYLDDYSNDIAIFKIGISIVFGFSLEFIEETFHKIIAKITGLTEKKDSDEPIESELSDDFSEQTEP